MVLNHITSHLAASANSLCVCVCACGYAQPSLEVVNSAVKPSISRNSFKVGNKKWRVFKLLMGFMFLSLLRVCSLL